VVGRQKWQCIERIDLVEWMGGQGCWFSQRIHVDCEAAVSSFKETETLSRALTKGETYLWGGVGDEFDRRWCELDEEKAFEVRKWLN
jgi:hypothetical protein